MAAIAAPTTFPDEFRERATRLAAELWARPVTRTGALRTVGEQLGFDPEMLGHQVTQAEVDVVERPAPITSDLQRLAELEQDDRGCAGERLPAQPIGSLCGELDRPQR